MRKIKNLFHLINALLAVVYYRYPARNLKVIAVTGTAGKTTTVHLIYEILKTAGKEVSMISTISAVVLGEEIDTGFHVTTPGPWQLQKIVRLIVDRGGEYLVLEVTSHGLDQNRIFGIPIEVAVITNVSHEHLDYHLTFDSYMKTKAKIMKKARISILNRGDQSFRRLRSMSSRKMITFSLKQHADYNLTNTDFKIKLLGSFNKYNCLAAWAVSKALGIEDKIISQTMSEFSTISGRMEEVNTQNKFRIFIDFAHKPEALKEALTATRRLTKGKLIAIFGAAGERDRLKRPIMGRIAAKLADYIILTAEDPRSEDVRDIISQIAQGILTEKVKEADKKDKRVAFLKKKGKYFWRIPDRQEAINFAIVYLAKRDDLIIFCGKGHEKSMCYGKKEYPWDEKLAVQKALRLYDSIKAS